MQKKLLFLCMMSCVIIQAGEAETVNQKDYTEYNKQQEELYHAALIKALSGKDKAIDDEDQNNRQENEDEAQNNEQENKTEEENKRKELYDGVTGYWGAEPTPNSEIGRKYQEFAQERIRKNNLNVEDKKKKDEIWRQFSTDTKVKKDTFDKKVLATLGHKLEEERYNICKDRLSGLINCRENSDCYHKRGLSPTIFTNPNFGTQYEAILYEDIAGFAAEQGIILTTEELKTIAENNSKTRVFCKGFKDGVKELSIKRDEILNPKKQDEVAKVD